jgi:hypothetical protein
MALTIYAKSDSLNQMVRRFDLTNILNDGVELHTAQRDADAFAQQQNSIQYLKATDWYGVVLDEQLGEQTFIEDQNSRPRPQNASDGTITGF